VLITVWRPANRRLLFTAAQRTVPKSAAPPLARRLLFTAAQRAAPKNAAAPLAPPARPPRGVRAALIGAAAGLGTPVFATAGVGLGWYRFILQNGSPLVRLAGSTIGLGAFGLIYEYAWPFLKRHSELLLPFAVANGVSAAAWFAYLERALGLSVMAGSLSDAAFKKVPLVLRWLPFKTMMRLGVPLGGPLVGALTALTAGFVYPPLAAVLWPAEMLALLDDMGFKFGRMIDWHLQLALPISIPVGVVGGFGVHHALSPFVLGTVAGGRHPWTKTAAPLLGGMLGAGVLFFYAMRPSQEQIEENVEAVALLFDGAIERNHEAAREEHEAARKRGVGVGASRVLSAVTCDAGVTQHQFRRKLKRAQPAMLGEFDEMCDKLDEKRRDAAADALRAADARVRGAKVPDRPVIDAGFQAGAVVGAGLVLWMQAGFPWS